MSWFHKLWQRKVLLGFIVAVVLVGVYYFYKNQNSGSAAPSYVTAAVTKGTLTVSISGSGQTSVTNQVDVKAKASGDAVKVAVVNGQEVKANDLLVQLDTREAYKAVRDAETSLESAQLSLTKLKQPVDQLSLLQAENALAQAKESKVKSTDDLAKAYDDAFNSVANTFLNIPAIITKLNDILYSNEISQAEVTVGGLQNNSAALVNTASSDDRNTIQSYLTLAQGDYQVARTKYDANFLDYRNTDRYSDRAAIGALLNETLTTTRAIAQAIKSQSNLLNSWVDSRSQRSLTIFNTVKGYQTSLSTYTSQTNGNLSSLLSSQQSLQDSQTALVSADRTIAEKTESLAKLKAGADTLDIQSQELAVKQRQNALLDAREKLADYLIRAPFDGIIAKVAVKKGDSVSSGTAVVTLITKQRTAEILLNEVDAVKIKVGQKSILTFDAFPDLSISGEVIDIDTLGTVSQGVVSYNVKIGFDTQDDRVKPGMSLSAFIITDVRQDVLLVPNAAVKSQNGQGSYVQVLQAGTPQSRQVQVGLSNDTMTEVSGNIQVNEEVVTKTVNGSTSTTPTPSSGGIPGLGGGGLRVGGFHGD